MINELLKNLLGTQKILATNRLAHALNAAQEDCLDTYLTVSNANKEDLNNPILIFLEMLIQEMRVDCEAINYDNFMKLSAKYEELLSIVQDDYLGEEIYYFFKRLTSCYYFPRHSPALLAEYRTRPERLIGWKETTAYWIDDFEKRIKSMYATSPTHL